MRVGDHIKNAGSLLTISSDMTLEASTQIISTIYIIVSGIGGSSFVWDLSNYVIRQLFFFSNLWPLSYVEKF